MSNNTPKYIIFHHSAVSSKVAPNQFFSIDRYHRDVMEFPKSSLGYYGGYHILVSGGKEYRYREDWEGGAHTAQVDKEGLAINTHSLAVCWAGNGDIELPSPSDLELIRARIQRWTDQYKIALENILPHRHFAVKTCPGRLLPDDFARKLLVPAPAVDPTKIEIAKLTTLDSIKDVLLRLKIWLDLAERNRKPPLGAAFKIN